MLATRRGGIPSHREQAADRTSARARTRSAELDRDNEHTWVQRNTTQSPKRPRTRTLAPMQNPGLIMQRRVQDYEEMREQSELSQVLQSFASDGAARHGRTVEHERSRLKEELSVETPSARLPAPGTHVILTGLEHGSTYNGREAVVVEMDGRNRVLVKVCGASELCQLSVMAENLVVLDWHDTTGEPAFEAGRDFSEIHKLATLHAQLNARREVERLATEADERKRSMENTARVESLLSTGQRSIVGAMATRNRCRYGRKCAKPDCMDLHPWEAGWVEGGANSGCNSKSKFKAAKGIYSLLTPVPRAKSKFPQQKHKASQGGSPKRNSALPIVADVAVEIDRLLAQAGVPVAARQAAHHNVIPLLCSRGPALPGQGQSSPKHFKAGAAICPLLNRTRSRPSQNSQESSTAGASRQKSLQELQIEQKALQRSLDGIDDAHAMYLEPRNPSSGKEAGHEMTPSHTEQQVYFSDDLEAQDSPRRTPTWRDVEEPASRRNRISKLVELKKAEWRRQKLVNENAILQEALAACGAVFSGPLVADWSSPECEETCLSPMPVKVVRGRPNVKIDDGESLCIQNEI